MNSFQGTLNISKGKITQKKETKGYIEIIIDNHIYKFQNSYAYPGFVDSHGHISSLGNKLNSLQLNECKSQEECIEKALNHKEFRGDWLIGYGWNNENWIDKHFPSKKILDAYFKDIPVCFYRVDGHSIWVNTKAMEIAGINNKSGKITGGKILSDKSGEPTGILIDNAMIPVINQIPKLSKQQVTRYIIDAIKELNKNGITEVHYMDMNPDFINLYKELSNENKLNLRIFSYLKAQNNEYKEYITEPYMSDFFNISGIKLYADGALGSRGAALIEPYTDSPRTKGILLLKEKELYKKIIEAINKELQVAVHSIGDMANRLTLRVFQKVVNQTAPSNIPFLRIEHAQIIDREDIRYLLSDKIIPSVQPIHCISDSEMAIKRIGQRCKNAYLWKSIIEIGSILLGGSDFPIESHNPLLGISSFVNRIENNEILKWYSDERIDINKALESYISSPRIICNNSIKTGKLEKGYSCDLVVLNGNLKEVKEKEFKNLKVLATFIEGKNVYLDDSFISN